VALSQIHTLGCDTDSHTSVALARIVLSEHLKLRPRFIDLRDGGDDVDARLLIGDKVVCAEPVGYAHQLDLGAAWKQMTGLPFVFAVWTARGGVDLADLPARLDQARRNGVAHLDQIVKRHGVPRGWPEDVAREYLSRYLVFDIGARQLAAVRLFHQLAYTQHLLDHAPRELDLIT
jgi:chorismate dehydratase